MGSTGYVLQFHGIGTPHFLLFIFKPCSNKTSLWFSPSSLITPFGTPVISQQTRVFCCQDACNSELVHDSGVMSEYMWMFGGIFLSFPIGQIPAKQSVQQNHSLCSSE
jgi:hypothetical protein